MRPLIEAAMKRNGFFGVGNVSYAEGTTRGNYLVMSNGHHAEMRGAKKAGDSVEGSQQYSSHNACDGCAEQQDKRGIVNQTGTAAENGGNVTRDLNIGLPCRRSESVDQPKETLSEYSLPEHERAIRLQLSKLPDTANIAFAAACAQRTVRLFEREAGSSELIRGAMARIWEWLLTAKNKPNINAANFEDIIPSPEDSSSEWFMSACVIYGFVSLLSLNGRQDYWGVAMFTLDLLEQYVYRTTGLEVTRENDCVVAQSPFIVQEMRRELRDIVYLADSDDSASVARVWRDAINEDVLCLEDGGLRLPGT